MVPCDVIQSEHHSKTISVQLVPVGRLSRIARKCLLSVLLVLVTSTSSWAKIPPLSSLSVLPSEITLDSNHLSHRLLVTGVTVDGFEVDLTALAQYVSDDPGQVAVDDGGMVRAIGEEGVVRITARFEGHSVSVAVVCRLTEPPKPPTFERNILPLINRAGCNAATCHATPDGQHGFKLSVFSNDPRSDYQEIVQEARGRRVFPANPEESLILKKPTMVVQHGGGLRFDSGSGLYRTLHGWIEAGMPYNLSDSPALVSIEVHPSERRYKKGAGQQLLVQARYSDDSVHDVTHLARFESRRKQFVTVDEEGLIAVGEQIGEQVVLVRYMDAVKFSRVIVPTGHKLSDEKYEALTETNFIDQHAHARWKKLGLFPSPRSSDSDFIRRASLDAIGRLPTVQETCAFLADTGENKREELIERLLDDDNYANYWATKWGDLIRPSPNRKGIKFTYLFDQWIRDSFRKNKPYDQLVTELVTATGPTSDGATTVIRDRRDPADMTTLVSRMFLGVRMECARCHHHPYEQWSQKDFYSFAAYFGRVDTRGADTFIGNFGNGEVKHPLTQEVMFPKPLDGVPAKIEPRQDPRLHLAEWMTDSQNPYFARAITNRIWAEYFGRGIVHPVDDFRPSNPPTNAALLDALAQCFIDHDFDLKDLMRTIMQSEVYQLSSQFNEYNVGDTQNFSRSYRRRLPAEVMLDAVCDVTGTRDALPGVSTGGRAIEAWNHKLNSIFLDAFGRPPMNVDCPCDRDTSSNMVQALHMMNSTELQARIADAKGRASRLIEQQDLTVRDILSELYLSAYSRYPTDEEIVAVSQVLERRSVDRKTATEDILWSLLNSAEFVYNH